MHEVQAIELLFYSIPFTRYRQPTWFKNR